MLKKCAGPLLGVAAAEGEMDFQTFLDLLNELDRHNVDYVLIGGVALNLHGIVRATEAIDLFVRAGRQNIERLKEALRTLWADPEIDEIRAVDLMGKYSTVRYGPPDVGFVIDLVTRLGTAFEFDDLDAEVVEVEGVKIRLATPETLFRMKVDTVRPIDHADAEALRDKFGLREKSE